MSPSKPKFAVINITGCTGCVISILDLHEKLIDVLEACAVFHWEFNGVWKNYEIDTITTNLVHITVLSWGYDGGYAEEVQFQNDETLIDTILEKL